MTTELPAGLTQKRLRALRQAYADQLPHRLGQIESAWSTMEQDWSAKSLESLRLMLRSLVGSGSIFGFEALSRCGNELETLLQDLAQEEGPPGEEHRSQVLQQLEALKQSCHDTVAGAVSVQTGLHSSLAAVEREKSKRLIFLVTRNGEMAADLSFQLGCFGYLVRTLPDCNKLSSKLDETPPAALVIDAEPFDRRLEEAAKASESLTEREAPIPILLLASRSDFESRLKAVRAGADGYFTQPPDVRRLVEKLEILIDHRSDDPYRILIVDANYRSALNYSLTLQRSGMTAALATRPEDALKELVDFQPELILMAVALPQITGPELVSIIRQEDAYVHVPVVFLSNERSVERQLEVMRSGANDLLAEPVETNHLISVLTFHVQRSRVLRYFMAHDSLTGLLNHTEIMERLEAEVELSQRHDRNVAYAILDIDHLKEINERYGHFSGDCVIKSLARLLTQRLRKTDIVGRYAGEELAVIMPDTSGQRAVRVLGEIRTLFAEVRHQSGEGVFFATFCGGVAALPGYDHAVALHDAARNALKAARQRGRNRVILSSSE